MVVVAVSEEEEEEESVERDHRGSEWWIHDSDSRTE